MTSQTLTRRSILTTDDTDANVLKAANQGDILRKLRNKDPQTSHLNKIAAAEAAVEETARTLSNLIQEYQQRVNRLNVLRQRHDLPLLAPEDLGTTLPDTTTDIVGRVIYREPLTKADKTAGTLLLISGEHIQWTASASYVDALDVLFDGVPIQVTGSFTATGSLSIQGAVPAPRSYWRDGEDYDRFAEVGPITVMAAALVKKELRQKHGNACHECGRGVGKRAKASVAYLADGPVLVCRPCKQRWIDAGRPTTT
ncbi:hypothetical protein [Streptomyces chilikensis]|uniref:Uncharacterized protein n=1 Tax=Streptomyces chilikensis TaxID=1194079 RepID=A0ABV3ERN7_9ACTN